MKLARPLLVLDLETTGTWIEKDRIIEVGMVRLTPAGERDTYLSRVNPGMPIPPRVIEVTGITDADVKDAPTFKQIAPQVLEFIGDADLGGFNAERFDLPILERELFLAGLKFERKNRTIYDAQKIYHLHEKRTLKAAYKFYCDKELVSAHTALGDTEATIEILSAQIEKYGMPAEGLLSLKNFDYERMDDYFDEEKKFRWWNRELYPVFGKYARKLSLKEIAKREPDYLKWLLTTDFSAEVKQMVQGILEGRFPAAPR